MDTCKGPHLQRYNLSIARPSTSIAMEAVTLLPCSGIIAVLRQERGTPASLDWKPPYPVDVIAKPYPLDYKVPKFQKYDSWSGNSKEHAMYFFDLWTTTPTILIFASKNSQSLWQTRRITGTPTWNQTSYVIGRSSQHQTRFTLVELGRTRQYSNEYLNVYVRRFHEKALDCCDLVDEEMHVDVCLHVMTEEYMVFLE